MEMEPGDVAVGVMMGLLGGVGLLFAARAVDDAIYVFGLSLAVFALLFVLGLIRRHYDRARPMAAAAGPRVASDV